jgi:geranylgeranyl diphosphate synthase type II
MPEPIPHIKERLKEKSALVEAYLAECLKDMNIPAALLKAMEYSLQAGGKRLRPALCLTCASLFHLAPGKALPFAAAIELIHTYSLVHDDLPAMDDDDLRRGKPSNHKMFGEAMAILAGDGLLTEAFGLMASTVTKLPAGRVLAALAEMAAAAGAAGMVGGQALDMEYTGRSGVSFEELKAMHALKTGALIRASCVSGALLAGAPEQDLENVRRYGEAVGAAFQIMDDILDEIGDEKTLGKPVGSDRDQGKTTYPSLLGLDKSRELAAARVSEAVAALESYPDEAAVFLRDVAQYILERVS